MWDCHAPSIRVRVFAVCLSVASTMSRCLRGSPICHQPRSQEPLECLDDKQSGSGLPLHQSKRDASQAQNYLRSDKLRAVQAIDIQRVGAQTNREYTHSNKV